VNKKGLPVWKLAHSFSVYNSLYEKKIDIQKKKKKRGATSKLEAQVSLYRSPDINKSS
jgi:hypothetical protein